MSSHEPVGVLSLEDVRVNLAEIGGSPSFGAAFAIFNIMWSGHLVGTFAGLPLNDLVKRRHPRPYRGGRSQAARHDDAWITR
jgi:membrane associated rhomboid family serine protease